MTQSPTLNKMKSKVIIENGQTEILLIPENEFEKDLVEKCLYRGSENVIKTSITTQPSYGVHQKHQISINITSVIK